MKLHTTIARLVILLQFTYTLVIYKTLPAVIPNAYDSLGKPHRFAPRAILWFFLLLNVGTNLLLSTLARHPNAFSLPADLDDPDRPRQTKVAVAMLSYLQILLALLLASQTWMLAHERSRTALAGTLPFMAMIVALLVTVFIGIYRMMTPPQDGSCSEP